MTANDVDDDLAGPVGSDSSELFHSDERDRQKRDGGGDRAFNVLAVTVSTLINAA